MRAKAISELPRDSALSPLATGVAAKADPPKVN
jgi:hypothetical protein